MLPRSTWLEVVEVRALMRGIFCLGIVAAVRWAVRRADQERLPPTVSDVDDGRPSDEVAPEFV